MSRIAMFAMSCRSILAGLMLVTMVSAWGCGGKEAAPPPGAENQPTKAPEISLPGAEPTTPPTDTNKK